MAYQQSDLDQLHKTLLSVATGAQKVRFAVGRIHPRRGCSRCTGYRGDRSDERAHHLAFRGLSL